MRAFLVVATLACREARENLNDAELGMMTLKQAMRNPSSFYDVLNMFEDADFSQQVGKMMADPTFQEQAKSAAIHAQIMTMEETPAKSLASVLLAANPATSRQRNQASQRSASVDMESLSELKDYAKQLNPVIGYWDPLKLVDYDQFGKGEEATIGFLRHAEIKHGRVAMAAFVGYLVQANAPWLEGSPPEQWDAMPTAEKIMIIQVVGALEFMGEWGPDTPHPFRAMKDGTPFIRPRAPRDADYKHYMKGGKPGQYPSVTNLPGGMTPLRLDVWDPLGTVQTLSAEEKETKLLAELNNGRLAMLGIFAFIAEAKVPGSVPLLKGLIKPYAGEPVAPFLESDKLPFVPLMSKFSFEELRNR